MDRCFCGLILTIFSLHSDTSISFSSSFFFSVAALPKVATDTSLAAADIAAAGGGWAGSYFELRTVYQPQPHQETTADNLSGDTATYRGPLTRRTSGPIGPSAR